MGNDELQFQSADFGEMPAQRCAQCQSTLTGKYYMTNGLTMCENCAGVVRVQFTRKTAVSDILRSIFFGLGAGIVGSLIYYAILKITGYEIGLVAILVGFMVGKAVFVGSGHRGGLAFRGIAVLITYIAIVSTYVPLMVEAIRTHKAVEQAKTQPTPGVAAATATPERSANEKAAPAENIPNGKNEAPAQVTAMESQGSGGGLVVGILILAGYILAIPFLAGLENIFGLLIILFALFEAARQAKRPVLSIEGPFEISPAAQSAPKSNADLQ